MHNFFEDEGFNFMALLTLGASYYGCSDVGECLVTFDRIEDGDVDDWVTNWKDLADRLQSVGDQASRAGHSVSAWQAYLRAARYYDTASSYADGSSGPETYDSLWTAHRAAFDAAVACVPNWEKVAIPFEGTTLEGYFFRAPGSGGPRRTIILNNGSDGSVLDMLGQGAFAANARGWNAITFDGPGQGAALHRGGLYFRPNWESVITPVVDYLLTRDDVLAGGIVLHGVSQGGYWVPRAAAFEHRLAAVVADPGVVDLAASWFGHLPPPMIELLDSGARDMFDEYLQQELDQSLAAKYTMTFRARPYGFDSFFDLFTAIREYQLPATTIGAIKAPILITNPEGEQFWPGQSQQLFDGIAGTKCLVDFTDAEGASWHCEPVALGLRDQRVFDWLDEVVSGS